MMDQAEEVAKEMLGDSTHLVESVKPEPPWSMTEESPDQPSAVYSTAKPMSDSTSGSWLSLNISQVCQHCFTPFVLASSLELHLASFHGDPLLFPQWTETTASSALHGVDDKNFDKKQEPPLSLKEESPDQPSAVLSTAEPLSDSSFGSLLSVNTSHVCQHCSGRFGLLSNLRLHLMFVHGEKLHPALPAVPTAGNGDAGGYGNQKKTKVEGGKGKADHNGIAEKKAEKTRTRKYVCEVCREDFSCARELRSHKRTHAGHKPFICDICSKAFAQSGHLRTHKLFHASHRSFVCDTCGKAFVLAGHLKTHKLYHTSLKPFVCEVCSKAFTVAFQLKRHKLIHSSHKPFVCDVCGKAFPGPNGLKVHKLFHTDRKAFVCDVCSKAFVMVYDLKRHKKIHIQEMQCKTPCHNTIFALPRGLQDDVSAAHTGKKLYVCDVCGKSFSCPSKLTSHQRTHTGEKPFTCDICATSFSHSGTLNRHKRIHARCDSDFVRLRGSQVRVRTASCTREKTYVCDVCGASFSSPSKLQSHQRTHTGEKPFACDVCETSFSHSSSLKRHRRIHTGEKPYVCTKCGERFAQSGSLKEHCRRHRGERPHACPHCPAAFVRSQLLKGHVKKEHQ